MFKLLQLPPKAQEAVCQNMSTRDLFVFSTISEQSMRIVEQSILLDRYELRFGGRERGHIRFQIRNSEKIGDLCQMWIDSSKPTDPCSDMFLGETQFSVSHTSETISISSENQIDALQAVLKQYKKTFGRASITIKFICLSPNWIPLLVNFSKMENVPIRSVFMEDFVKEEGHEVLEKELFNHCFFESEELELFDLRRKFNDVLKVQRTSNAKSIFTNCTSWFTYRHFEKLPNCTYFMLIKCEIESRDVNNILKDWVQSNAKYTMFQLSLVFGDRDTVLEGLDYRPFTGNMFYEGTFYNDVVTNSVKYEVNREDGGRAVITPLKRGHNLLVSII